MGAKSKVPARPRVLPTPPRPDPGPRRPTPTAPTEILRTILEPLTRGEGFRHGWLGDSRMGKTYANRWLLEEGIDARLIDQVLILDDKGPEPQYPGLQRANVAHLRRELPTEEQDSRIIVLRGHTMRTGEVCPPDDPARAAFELALLPGSPRVAVSIDELRRAVSPAGREWRSTDVPRLFSEGGGLGVSVTWTTQSPQRIPLEAFDQTETFGIFRCGRRAVNYLADQDMVEPEVLAILPGLQRGEWVFVETGAPWDGRVYKLGLRR